MSMGLEKYLSFPLVFIGIILIALLLTLSTLWISPELLAGQQFAPRTSLPLSACEMVTDEISLDIALNIGKECIIITNSFPITKEHVITKDNTRLSCTRGVSLTHGGLGVNPIKYQLS